MSKKIYINIDKPIEVGDLVRCVREDGLRQPGDIREVYRMGVDSETFFYVYGLREPLWKNRWEPVRVIESRRPEMDQGWSRDEAVETKTTGCHYCRGIESHDIVAIKTVLDEYSRMVSAYDTPYNYCPNCGRKIRKD